MAIQLINIGQVANDGTGDDLREAMVKINQNFEELDLRDDEQTTASNVGAVGEGVFAQKLNYDLQFKKLVPGKDITLTPTDDTITIDANGGLKRLLVISDGGSLILEESASINFSGGNNVSTSLSDNTVVISYEGWSELVEDTTPTLGGNLDAAGLDITNVGNITAASVTGSFTGSLTGNVTGLVHNIDIRDINDYLFTDMDFGEIFEDYSSKVEWLLAASVVDMGTFKQPSGYGLDGRFI